MLQRTQMLQRIVFINKIRKLQRTQILQRRVFINKIRMLQRTQTLQRRVFIDKIRMLHRTVFKINQNATMNTDATTKSFYQ